VRHAPVLERADWLWDRGRPAYDRLVTRLARSGLERAINGTDRLLLLPRFRQMAEAYEPEVWHQLMRQVRPGDVFADVGAFIGFYSIAVARLVGDSGRVFAFEPDPQSFAWLDRHVELNRLTERIELVQAAVGARCGMVGFEAGKSSESRLSNSPADATQQVECVTLDSVFADRRLDILKIDVEGFEEDVLNGGINLLRDKQRSPRVIYLEAHPYAWPSVGTTSQSLIGLLAECGYTVQTIDGAPLKEIRTWGEILARKCDA
jgi:FkbM family methyltransferase